MNPKLAAAKAALRPQKELGKSGIKAACKRLYESVGGVVYNTSGGVPKRNANTPGLSDLIVFFPRRGKLLFHETKTPTGKLSDAQRDFEALCLTVPNVWHVAGGLNEARAALRQVGLMVFP